MVFYSQNLFHVIILFPISKNQIPLPFHNPRLWLHSTKFFMWFVWIKSSFSPIGCINLHISILVIVSIMSCAKILTTTMNNLYPILVFISVSVELFFQNFRMIGILNFTIETAITIGCIEFWPPFYAHFNGCFSYISSFVFFFHFWLFLFISFGFFVFWFSFRKKNRFWKICVKQLRKIHIQPKTSFMVSISDLFRCFFLAYFLILKKKLHLWIWSSWISVRCQWTYVQIAHAEVIDVVENFTQLYLSRNFFSFSFVLMIDCEKFNKTRKKHMHKLDKTNWKG